MVNMAADERRPNERRMGSFGERLRKEREQKGISLEDISLETKIGTRLLRALEEEHFDQLPGGIFNKGFVRAYARHLGLDEEQLIQDYLAAIGTPPVPAEETFPLPVPQREAQPDRPARRVRLGPPQEIPWGLLAIALLVIALGFASWTYLHRPAEARREAPAAAPQPRPVSSPAPGSPGSETAKPAQTSSPPAPAESGHPISRIPATESARDGSAPVSPAALHDNSPSPLGNAPGMFSVRLKGNDDSEECWVAVSVDGQPPVESTLIAPYEKVVQAKNEVTVKIGNAGALDVFFNGKRLPSLGEFGEVRTLVFHADGLQAPSTRPTAPLVR